MEKAGYKNYLGTAIMLGSVWGLGEVALGMGLKACAASASGSIMTAVALFFIALGWQATKRWFVPLVIVLTASVFKLFDALVLGLPVIHGAIANPVFAFWMEGIAIMGMILLLGKGRLQNRNSRILLGASSALIAAGLFPLVRFATTIPACVYAGTAVPLSVMFAPVAMILSAVTVPLAFAAADRITEGTALQAIRKGLVTPLFSPVTFVVCLALVFLFRLVVPMSFS